MRGEVTTVAVTTSGIRLQKFLAEAGVASRRGGEALMTSGRVVVNGRPVTLLGARVDPVADRVTVDGVVVRPRRKLYVALNKPRGYLSTRRDPESRRTVLGLLPKEWESLYPVGRLDCDSEGLLFLSNDGAFCARLTHPRFGVRKSYLVEVRGRFPAQKLEALTQGVEDRGETLRAESVKLIRVNNTRSVFRLELSEGKNREVRRLFQALGAIVLRLQRIRIGPIKLGQLPVGRWRVLTDEEVRSLMRVSDAR